MCSTMLSSSGVQVSTRKFAACSSPSSFTPFLLLFALHGRRVGQALAPKAIPERLRSGGVWEAESNIDLLDLVPTPAAAYWDASFTSASRFTAGAFGFFILSPKYGGRIGQR